MVAKSQHATRSKDPQSEICYSKMLIESRMEVMST